MNVATTAQPTRPTGPQAQGQQAPMPVVPFARASIEHSEPFYDGSATIAANPVPLGPLDVPAYGYMRAVLVWVSVTGGTGTAAVYKEDAPWSVLSEVTLQDVNGAPIVGPITGYQLFLANRYGGYDWSADPTANVAYTAPTTAGNFSFVLRIPVEINRRDPLGPLPNMNAGQTYKLRLTQAAKGDVYSTDPTGLPTVRVRLSLEAWTAPNAQAADGSINATSPPALGTTQFWTYATANIASGNNVVRLPRVGNLIRNLIVVFRNTSDGLRSTTNLPADVQLMWDGRIIEQIPKDLIRWRTSTRYGYSTLEAGTLVWDFTHDFDGKPGDELRDLWLATKQSTRLELVGSFGAAGQLQIVTNDVAPAGNIWSH